MVKLILPSHLRSRLPKERRSKGAVALNPGPWTSVMQQLRAEYPELAERVLTENDAVAVGFVVAVNDTLIRNDLASLQLGAGDELTFVVTPRRRIKPRLSPMRTFAEHLAEQRSPRSLTRILSAVMEAAKNISLLLRGAQLAGVLGRSGTTNVHGEETQKLDGLAQQALLEALHDSQDLCWVVSEESEAPILISSSPEARWILGVDPIDGSGNIDVSAPVGTVFSVFERPSLEETATLEDCLQRGIRQVAAGYVVYGSSTVAVYSQGAGVHGFTLDPTTNELLLTHPNLRIPTPPRKEYSVNEAYAARWSKGQRRLRDELVEDGDYSLRYIGSMVADVHRTLLRGGLVMYPIEPRYPQGRLRLLYEAAPVAFLCEQAGGEATDGSRRILDLPQTSIHQRTALYLGARELMAHVRRTLD